MEEQVNKVPRDLYEKKLYDWASGKPVPPRAEPDPPERDPLHVVVFVHGILSNHTRFQTCYEGLRTLIPGLDAETAGASGADHAIGKNWRFYYVNYDYHTRLIENGEHLAATIIQHFHDRDHVVLVGHSMGGLLIRLACLLQKLPCVRTVFLLGTPNHGAFRTSSLGILMQMTRGITGQIWGLRPRKVGIFDLTRVDAVIKPHLENAEQTADIDYISIPGRYFHDQRGALEHHLNDVWKVIFGGLDAGFELVRGVLPLLKIHLARAHDGIVEEASNSLIPDWAERTSEKQDTIRLPRDPGSRTTYAHLVADSAIDRVHVEIPDDDLIIALIAEIIVAPNLEAWLVDGPKKYRRKLNVFTHNRPPD
jgi:pimeloyl-ACP methyl ester carboxylesterase